LWVCLGLLLLLLMLLRRRLQCWQCWLLLVLLLLLLIWGDRELLLLLLLRLHLELVQLSKKLVARPPQLITQRVLTAVQAFNHLQRMVVPEVMHAGEFLIQQDRWHVQKYQETHNRS
jgi:hypothetical protein